MNKTSWQRAWYILRPYIIYMVAKTAVLYLLAMTLPSAMTLFSNNAEAIVEANKNLFSAVINSVSSIIGVLFVIKDFAVDMRPQDATKKDFSPWKSIMTSFKDGLAVVPKNLIAYGIVISLGITASIAFNVIVSLLSVESGRYDVVEKIQYSVPLWLGLILYGLVSPVVEEIVFRGITYNRIKGFFGPAIGIILNAVLFGMFHANLPQFLYGTIMGIIITLCYEWIGSFAAPVLLHMAANVFVFVFSNYYGDVNINTWGIFAIFATISALLLAGLWYYQKSKK